jgi:UPF0176 protein
MGEHKVILFYKFVLIRDPKKLKEQQILICKQTGIHSGRIIVSTEGINGTLEGSDLAIYKYIKEMQQDTRFSDINFKISTSNGDSFPKIIDPATRKLKPKLSIKVREELVTTNLKNHKKLGPLAGNTGKYVTAEELHSWFETKKEFYIVDMRNDYEYEIGHFQDSIMLKGFRNFRDLENVVEQIKDLSDKTIVTVCTGGIRCEKASGFLLEEGFMNVYQLKDGIVSYMEKYPNQNFLGKLYVFDSREMIGFNTESHKHKAIGKCRLCGCASENLVDYYNKDPAGDIIEGRFYGIICKNCISSKKVVLDTEVINDFTLNQV